MFRNTKELQGYTVCATDGGIGEVRQFLFDEDTWTVRYLLTGTGDWLEGRQVLVSPIAVTAIDDHFKAIKIGLKQAQVAAAPQFNPARPVTRGYERDYYSYYGWPVYWGLPGRWGNELMPSSLFTVAPVNEAPVDVEDLKREKNGPLIHGTGDIANALIYAQDDPLGTVKGFLIDDGTWALSYIVVDASSVEPGRTVLLSPHWIASMSFFENLITVDLSLDAVRSAPAYNAAYPVTRDYEERLFEHYGRSRELDAVRIGSRVLA